MRFFGLVTQCCQYNGDLFLLFNISLLQILLFPTPLMLHVIQSLSTCLLLLLIPLLTLIIDPEMRYRLAACSVLRHRVQVPTEDY